MKQSFVPAGAMIVGLVLMFFGYVQESLVPNSAVWTDEQAKKYSDNSARMHNAAYAGHDHSKANAHGEPDRNSPEYLKVKADFEKSKADLAAALNRQVWAKYGIILLGVAIAGFGIVRVAIDKMRADEETTLRRPAR
jgi:hypothetical protein